MKNSSMITICIPLYQSDFNYVQKAVESVLTQTSSKWKLVLVDGSSEPELRSKQWIASLVNPSISYVANEGDKTMAGNWNFAFSAAQTDLVTLLHDDDFLHEDYVKEVLGLSAEQPQSSGYFCGAYIVNSRGGLSQTVADSVKRFLMPKDNILRIKGDKGLASLLKANFIFCPTICYRKSQLDAKPFSSDWKMVTDLDFYQKTIHEGGEFVGLKKQLYYYRRHSENQTSKLTQSLERFSEECEMYSMIATSYAKSEWPQSVKAAKAKSMIKLHVGYLTAKSLLLFDLKQFKRLFSFAFALLLRSPK